MGKLALLSHANNSKHNSASSTFRQLGDISSYFSSARSSDTNPSDNTQKETSEVRHDLPRRKQDHH